MKIAKWVVVASLAGLLAASLGAVETGFWQIGSFDDLLQGTLESVSLTRDGVLQLAPEARAEFNPEETMALSVAADSRHNLYLGTGHQGKVFRVDSSLKGGVFFNAPEPDIFALAVGPDGTLYVGSSPDGKIYRVTPDGKSSVYFDPKAKYIWALKFDSQGRLYAGTGDRGIIYRIENGRGDVFYDSKQTHIMCLAFDGRGDLLAGSVPNGLIFRINPQGKAFLVYQSTLPEIHDLATDPEGHIYAATLGGPGGQGFPQMFGPPVPARTVTGGSTTVTVTASADEARDGNKAQVNPGAEPSTQSFNRPAPGGFGFQPPPMGQGRGSLIAINPDNSVETLWTSNNESIFGLAVRGGHVLFSTDLNGRIFELTPSRDSQGLTLLTETHDSLSTRLMLEGQTLYAATSNVARLLQLGSALAREGTYLSPAKDTKFVSSWGVIAWRGAEPAGTTLEFYTRSGNSDRPDKTWSDWTGPYRDAGGSRIQSPPARFIQWKAVLRTSGAATPTLDDVTLTYLNQNLPPQIKFLNLSTGGERTGGAGGMGPVPSGNISLPAGAPGAFGGAAQREALPPSNPVVMTWQAEDPNGDQLVYSLYVKSSDEQEWHLLKDKIRQNSFAIDPHTLPDGKYVAKLVASDEESNPPSVARKAELVSAPFWVDSTPPQVRAVRRTPVSAGIDVQFEAEDATSPLRSAELSIDGTEWRDQVSDDGIVDSRRETFTVRARNLPPGEHVILLRAWDTAGNVGVGKAVVTVPAATGR